MLVLHHISLRQKIIVMAAVMSGLFLVALDQTIIATALGQIVEDFNSFESLGLVVTVYLLTSTVTVPIAGRMSDLFGRKKTLLAGVAIFTIASFLSGASGNIEQLIIFRALKGVGGGIITANAFTIVGDLFNPRERGRWQGFVGAVFGIASVVGPLLGGWLTDGHMLFGVETNWRWTFFINVPIGIVAAGLIARFSPSIKHDKKPVVDYAGAASIAVALSAIVLAVDNTETVFSWLIDSGVALRVIKAGLMVIALAATVAFVWAEGRAKQPIIPLSFFKNRTYTSVMVAALLFGAAFLGAILYLTQFNQQVFGAGATEAGLMLLPMVGGMVFTSIAIGQVVSRTGVYKRYIVAGFSLATLGVFALSILTPDTPYWHEAVIMVFVGIGLGAGMPIMNLAVQNEFEQKDLGAATASSQLFRGLGSTIGVAVLSAVLTNGVNMGIGDLEGSKYVQVVRQSSAAEMIPEPIDANAALQINARSDQIKIQSMQAIDQLSIPEDIKAEQRTQFISNQSKFRRTVVEAFSDALKDVFYTSASLMAIAVIAVSFIQARELKSSKAEGPGIARGDLPILSRVLRIKR